MRSLSKYDILYLFLEVAEVYTKVLYYRFPFFIVTNSVKVELPIGFLLEVENILIYFVLSDDVINTIRKPRIINNLIHVRI